MGNTLDSCSGMKPVADDDDDINSAWLNTSSFMVRSSRHSGNDSFGRAPSFRQPMEIAGRAPSYLAAAVDAAAGAPATATASPLHRRVAKGAVGAKRASVTGRQPEFDTLLRVLKNRTPFNRLDDELITLAALRFEYKEYEDGETVVERYSDENPDPWQFYTVLIEGAFEQKAARSAGAGGGEPTRLTKSLKTLDANDHSPDILGEVEIVHRQTKCDHAWVARLDLGLAEAADPSSSEPLNDQTTTGADGKKKTRKDAKSGPKIRAYHMSARDFRGVFRVVIQEIENDDAAKMTLETKTRLLKGAKAESQVYKLCELLKMGKDGDNQLAMACDLLEGAAGEHLVKVGSSAPPGSPRDASGADEKQSETDAESDAAETKKDCGSEVEKLDAKTPAGKASNISGTSNEEGGEELYLVMTGACSYTVKTPDGTATKSFKAGQFFTAGPAADVICDAKEGDTKCQVLKLGEVEVGMFFGGEKPHDMLTKSGYVQELEGILDHIYSPEEQAKRRKARPWETLYGYKSNSEAALTGQDLKLNKKASILALKSCNMNDLDMVKRKRRGWRRRRELIGVLTFKEGTTVFKNGQLNDLEQVKKGFRGLCGKSFATFVVRSGKLRVQTSGRGEAAASGEEVKSRKEARVVRHVGPNEYIPVNPHELSLETTADVVAESDTKVFVVRLLDKASHTIRKGPGIGAKLPDLGWCCGPRDMREFGQSKKIQEHGAKNNDDSAGALSQNGRGNSDALVNQVWDDLEMRTIQETWTQLHGLDQAASDQKTDLLTTDEKVNQVWDGLGESDKPVGKGMLGNVFCVRPRNRDLQITSRGAADKQTRAVFAAKVMRKEDVINKRQTNAVLRELRAMSDADIAHPFIVNMFCTWQTDTKLVMLLEYMDGGELHLLGRSPKKGWPSLDAFAVRFYSACVLSALTHIHETLGCVYRDLKGENVMIDRQGYAKLVDFGFCKKLRADASQPWGRTSTVCGTPEYMAPEIIGVHEKYRNSRYGARGGYGPSVDFWALGVLIYERVYKYSPFSSRGKYSKFPQLFANIMDDRYRVANGPNGEPGRMNRLLEHDPDCYDIIDQLLTRDASRRLGYERRFDGGGREIMEHPFFIGSNEAAARGFPSIDFEALERRSLRGVPWTPNIPDDVASGEEWSHGLKKFMRRRVRKHEKGSPRTAEELAAGDDEAVEMFKFWGRRLP